MKIINLTPHDITLITDEKAIVFPSKGIARARQIEAPAGVEELALGVFIPVVKISYGALEGLPEPRDGVRYIVSFITAMAAMAHGRSTDDLLMTADLVRDEEGQITGCKKFSIL